MKSQNLAFQELNLFVKKLRKECPWDSKQTFESLRPLFIEEVYEATSVENEKDRCDELGDILFHILLQTSIASESGDFTIDDVIQNIFTKLNERHPEISSGSTPPNLQNQISNWHEIKRKNKVGNLLDDLNSSSVPALVRAFRIQKKVATIGFDWNNRADVLKKVYEELTEIENATSPENLEEEFGDFLFSIVNYSRFLKIDPEISLQNACKKFNKRFSKLEDIIKSSDKILGSVSLEEMDNIWNVIKSKE